MIANTNIESAPIMDPVHLQIRRVIVPIVAMGLDLSFAPIGTAFIIGAFGKWALALTAGHNIQEIFRLERPYDTYHPTTLPEFRVRVREVKFETIKMGVVCYDRHGKPHFASVERAYTLDEADIGVCVLHIEDEREDVLFEKKIAIDTRLPKKGTPIAVLGYSKLEVPDHVIEDQKARVVYSETLTRRNGEVLDVFPEVGPRNQQMPCFQCSTPFDSGMSGGPVIDLSQEPGIAIGVISSDCSLGELEKGDGLQAIACGLWLSMAIRMKHETLGDIQAPTLLDFQKQNLIEDRGRADEYITLNQDGTLDKMVIGRREAQP
jgi:hypothetical protein